MRLAIERDMRLNGEIVLTVKEACDYTGKKRPVIMRLCRSGKIGKEIAGLWWIYLSQIKVDDF